MHGVIPKIFHRIWLGGDDMPSAYSHYGKTWLDLNPGWEMQTWTEANLPPLRNSHVWDRATSFALMSDLARHEILSTYGGVYVDTDFECLRNIEPLLAGAQFVAGWQDARSVCTAFVAATPDHPIVNEMIELMPQRIANHPDAGNSVQTGPILFTEVVTPHSCNNRELLLHEPHILYPYHWTEPDRPGEAFPEAYAVHHWARSW